MFKKDESVLWNDIICTIHHFSQDGFETVAWLEGVPEECRTNYGGWQKVSLTELSKRGDPNE